MAENIKEKKISLKDLIWILICFFGTVFFLCLFVSNLFQTMQSDNEPIGTITYRHNTVERQPSSRRRWERLINQSPVYSGDLIRTADVSEAVIDTGGGNIILHENSMILIQVKKGIPVVEQKDGSFTPEGNIFDDKGRKYESGKKISVNNIIEKTATVNTGSMAEMLGSQSRSYYTGYEPPESEAIDKAVLSFFDMEESGLLPVPDSMEEWIEGEVITAKGGLELSWSEVPDATAYIVTLFKVMDNIKTQTNQRMVYEPKCILSAGLLGPGKFVWQVEAVSRRNGAIEQHGEIGVSSFFVNVPKIRPIELGEPGAVDDE